MFAALPDPAHPEQIGVFVVIWVSLVAAALFGIVAATRGGFSAVLGEAPDVVYGAFRPARQTDSRQAESA